MGTRPPRALLALGGATALIAVAPLAYLAVRLAEAGPARVAETLVRPRTLETLGTSLALVAIVVGACVLIGVPVAWLIARSAIPGARAWGVLVVLPLAIPSYVSAYAWIAEFPWIGGLGGAALVLTLCSLPYVVLPTAAALRSVDPAMEELARSLGRGPVRAFLVAAFPQAWPATAAGALLVGLYVLSDFGAVALMRVDAFTRVIFMSYRASFDRTSAAVLASLLVLLALALVLAERRVRGRGHRWRAAGGTARRQVPVPLTRAQRAIATAGLAILVVLGIGVPVASLLRRLAEGSRTPLVAGELVSALMATAWLGVLAAAVAVALALPVGILAARYRTRAVRTIEAGAFTGHALPGVVVGLSLVFLTITLAPAIYQTVATLVLAYAVLFLPKAIGAARASVAAVPPGLEDAARSLGRGPLRAWTEVTGRIALPGIAAGGLLVMVTAMKELPATLMLRPTGLDTLATELWSRTEVSAYGAAAPYALALVAVAAVPAWLLSRPMSGPVPRPSAASVDGAPLATVDA